MRPAQVIPGSRLYQLHLTLAVVYLVRAFIERLLTFKIIMTMDNINATYLLFMDTTVTGATFVNDNACFLHELCPLPLTKTVKKETSLV